MNLSISNKGNDFLVLYDQFGNIVLENTNIHPLFSKLWSLVQTRNFKTTELMDDIKLNYKLSFNNVKLIDKEIYNSHNYFYIKVFNENLQNITFKKNMKVFDVLDLITIPLSLSTISVFFSIFKFVTKDKNKIEKLEQHFLEHFSLDKKNERVYYTKTLPSQFSYYEARALREIAKIKNEPILRICLHQKDNENINEMLMVHSFPHKVGPLKQANKHSISYFAIDGFATITQYDDKLNIIEKIMISSDKEANQFCRIDATKYRTIESHSSYFIFIETCSGPFKDEDTIWHLNSNRV